MKRIIYFSLITFLVIMGCSKDELINETSENNLIKKGHIDSGALPVSFIGNSVESDKDEDFHFLIGLEDGSKISKKGIFSGKLTGYGKINPLLSSYEFASCEGVQNLLFGIVHDKSVNRSRQYNYNMGGTGIVSLTTRDYFEFTITNALLAPYNYEPYSLGSNESVFYGAIFGCPINNQGEALITNGAGKLKNLKGKKLEIFNNGNGNAIDRTTGKMSLHFSIY